jgi:NAD(P)-dependent dehydrogenase (short-subunit alcohol dehydrogenase family)
MAPSSHLPTCTRRLNPAVPTDHQLERAPRPRWAPFARVVICDVNSSGIPQALEDLPAETLKLTVDVSNEAECDEAVSQVVRRLGRIDALVNNAGIFQELRGTLKQDLPSWRRIMDVSRASKR